MRELKSHGLRKLEVLDTGGECQLMTLQGLTLCTKKELQILSPNEGKQR